jgi:hypothetical protein
VKRRQFLQGAAGVTLAACVRANTERRVIAS